MQGVDISCTGSNLGDYMSTKVVNAPKSDAKRVVKEKTPENQEDKLALATEDQEAEGHDGEAHADMSDAQGEGDTPESETSFVGDFSFGTALAEAAASAGSLISEGEKGDSAGYGLFGDDDDSGGTVLLIGAVALVGLGAIALAGGGGGGSPNGTPTVDNATQSITTAEDAPKTFTVSASDPDGDALTYTASGAAHGTVTGGANGSFTYTPAADYNGSDSFTVTVKDPEGATVTQSVSVTITAVNDAPRPGAENTSSLTLDEDTSAVVVIDWDDPEGDAPLTLNVTQGPAHGTFALVNGDNVYTPDANYFGSDTIKYTVSDSTGLASAEFTVAITVNDVAEPPVSTVSIDVVGDSPTTPKTIAAAGDEFIFTDSATVNTDVLITGEASFHACLECEASGIALVLPGHYASERFAMESLAERLSQGLSGVDTWASEREADPLRWF